MDMDMCRVCCYQMLRHRYLRLVLRMAVPTAACRVLGSTVATRMHLHIVDIFAVFLWVGCMYAMIAGGLGAPIAAKSDKTFFYSPRRWDGGVGRFNLRALYWDTGFGVSLDFLLRWEHEHVKGVFRY
ncbi:hypothetical protein F5Y00DRAFT_101573 [Daldinia vernicosa]|uniref:uncharacterized protein n=1 Tax=Daldinia vernicosa TaxID=114800 RepID=UPI0020079C02|nr:uncharacterized protein F5Y00DRAFT_101573 [Daldinia vernicosa]KAI0853451.1 hypothetical protein F5Y00DRAFT_101573 [Daldinia vernicosa]